ncbi:MAG: hypothetical protein KGZ83_05835 [Sulfuricella sp.]|nr:hypothetical protein [Sulfuricella sp.]
MKSPIRMLFLAAALLFSGSALADADDAKWINKCIADNKDEGAKASVVRKYCECMNDKMDSNETQSISQWEKSHPKEMKECEIKAGWK